MFSLNTQFPVCLCGYYWPSWPFLPLLNKYIKYVYNIILVHESSICHLSSNLGVHCHRVDSARQQQLSATAADFLSAETPGPSTAMPRTARHKSTLRGGAAVLPGRWWCRQHRETVIGRPVTELQHLHNPTTSRCTCVGYKRTIAISLAPLYAVAAYHLSCSGFIQLLQPSTAEAVSAIDVQLSPQAMPRSP